MEEETENSNEEGNNDEAKEGSQSDTSSRYPFTRDGMSRLLADILTNKSPIDDIALVLNAGADVNREIVKGLRPIHYAAYVNYFEGVKLLLDKGADIDAHDEIGYSPLHIAAKHGNIQTVQLLVERGASVNYCDGEDSLDESSRTLGYLTVDPLNLAIENNHPECAEILLLGGASPNHKYFLGYEINMAPLHNHRCIELLLQYGAFPDSLGRNGLSPLMRACREQNEEAVRLLIHFGATIDLLPHYRFEQKTALYFAVLGGNVEIIKLLLDAGGNTGRVGDYKYSPLEFAITQSKYDVCKMFIDYGVNVNEVNGDLCSPLQVACSITDIQDQHRITNVLLENGANPNYYSPKGYSYDDTCCLTPIVEYLGCYCYLHDGADLMKLLLRYGAWINVTPAYERRRIVDPNGVLHIVRKISLPEYVYSIIKEVAFRCSLEAVKNCNSSA